MQDLNKHQIILLCILISFVVSIATGIMTTSLLMEAPVQLTQTVNRVVERTIETVTPAPTLTNPNPPSKQVETVVVNVDDSVTSAIAKNTQAVVRIREVSADGLVNNFYGLGLVVTKGGIIVSDKKTISNAVQYKAVMFDDTEILLVPVVTDKKSSVIFFKAKPQASYVFSPVKIGISDVRLGQTLVVIGGSSNNAISVGRVISINIKDVPSLGTSTPLKYISSIVSDVSPEDNVPGAPLVSLSGDVVGLSLSSFPSSKFYLPGALIKQELDSLVIAE